MRRILALLPPLLLAGCAGGVTDPYARPGAWRPAGVNEANLRTMLARPGDYAQGVGEAGADAQGAAAAVDRLRRDRVKPLPDTTLVRIGGGGAGSATP